MLVVFAFLTYHDRVLYSVRKVVVVIKLVLLQGNRCDFSVRTSGYREKHGYTAHSIRLYLSNDKWVSIGSLHYYRGEIWVVQAPV
jgi:hypothetical protein